MLPSEFTLTRTSKWIVGGMIALVLLSLQGCWRLQRSQATARRAESNWQDCQQLAETIAALRQQPALASLDNPAQQDLAKSVTAAVSEAGGGPEVVRSIDPQRPSRIGSTSYERQTTQVNLVRMDLSVLVAAIHNLVTRHAGLHATAIELKPSSAQNIGEQTWDVGLTLTRLMYRP